MDDPLLSRDADTGLEDLEKDHALEHLPGTVLGVIMLLAVVPYDVVVTAHRLLWGH